MENYLDLPDVEKLTARSSATILRWMRLGRFPRATHRRGRRLYWLRAEVEAAIARLQLPVPMQAVPQSETATAG